ncbi:MAG: hypothetical protein M3389_16850, partial [Actinomycetota bacterium]|nr:hypothetical protein [Actinomycetota bacterium]
MWSPDEFDLGGELTSAPAAATPPGSDELLALYCGIDNGLRLRSRAPRETWTHEQNLGGQLTSAPIAAVEPVTDVLQVFYRSADNSLRTRWRNRDGTWPAEYD